MTTDRAAAARRVLLVETNDDGTTGGSYQCLADLATRLDRSRFEPVVLFYHENAFADRLRRAGIAVHVWETPVRSPRWQPLPRPPLPARLRGLQQAVARRLRFLRREGIALVHLNNSPARGWNDWLPASRLAGIPCLTHARGGVPRHNPWWRRYWIRRFDRVIAISQHVAAAMIEAGISPARVVLVYDGIDAEEFRSRVRRPPQVVRGELGVPDGRMLVAMVGHVRWWKGQDVVLHALGRMDRDTRSRLFVVFVGPTPVSDQTYRDQLDTLVTRLGLGDTVTFMGQREDIPDLMNAADVVVHASTRPEPFGLVVLEGMALGKPVVASALGGPSEIVTEGAGVTFNPADPSTLTAVLEDLVRHPERRVTVAAGAQARAAAFPVSRTVAEIELVYEQLLGKRG
jgi:glycosyltransferase involved in cell wall biosynthesis